LERYPDDPLVSVNMLLGWRRPRSGIKFNKIADVIASARGFPEEAAPPAAASVIRRGEGENVGVADGLNEALTLAPGATEYGLIAGAYSVLRFLLMTWPKMPSLPSRQLEKQGIDG
jgi:hypothetical protein